MSTLVGYPSVVERPYDMGWHDEVIARSAFSKTLAEDPDVMLNLIHGDGGSGLPLARTGRNMTLAEDPIGLRAEADLDDDDPDVMLLNRKVKAGLINDMSFAFRIVRETWLNQDTLRRILEISLHRGDITVTPHGANPAAGVVSLRSSALAHLRAPGRDTAQQRHDLVEQIGRAGVLEMRSVTLNGVDYGLGGEPSHPRGDTSRGRFAVAPVVLPDFTSRAKLGVARARSNPNPARATPSSSHRLPHRDFNVPDPVREARRALEAARARHR